MRRVDTASFMSCVQGSSPHDDDDNDNNDIQGSTRFPQI